MLPMSTKDHQRAPPMSYLCGVLENRRERLHLQTPRADTCTLPGTARADSGGSKNETKKN